jgi:hypothetical protein
MFNTYIVYAYATCYTKIDSNCKAGYLYCWASEDGPEGAKYVRPYK